MSVGVLALLAWKAQVRLGTIGQQLSHAHWGILGGTLVFSALFHVFVGADKWWRILRALGAKVTYWEVFRVRLGSDPIRFAAPLKAGELVNALHFGKLESLGFSRAAGSVVFDKSLNLFGTVFWLYVGFAALAKAPMLWELVVHLLVGASVLVLICSRRFRWAIVAVAGRLHPKLGRFGSGVLSAFEEFSPVSESRFPHLWHFVSAASLGRLRVDAAGFSDRLDAAPLVAAVSRVWVRCGVDEQHSFDGRNWPA